MNMPFQEYRLSSPVIAILGVYEEEIYVVCKTAKDSKLWIFVIRVYKRIKLSVVGNTGREKDFFLKVKIEMK